MHKLLTFTGAVAALAACAPAASPPASAPDPVAVRGDAQSNLPPILDREIFFGDPEIAGGQISPDGRFISFRKPLDGVMNVWVKGIDEPFEAARPVTADTARPVSGYFWSRDGRYLLFVQDAGGNENFHVYAVDPAASPAPGKRVPAARDLTPDPQVRAMIYAVPEKTPGQILVGINDRDPQLHDVYRVELATGKRTLVVRNDQNVAGWVADLEGNVRLGVRQTPDGGTEVLRLDEGGKLTPVYTCSAEESCAPVRFHKGGKRVYMTTDRGEANLSRLTLFDPQTRKEEIVESDPEGQVDFGGAEFSSVTDELVATYYVGDRLRVYPKDPRFARDYEAVRRALPEGDVYFGSSTANERLHLVSVTSDVDPGATYLYDRETGEVELLYRPRPNLPTEHLASMQPVRYRARDGVEIPAYLTVPKGVEARNLPVVMLIHGGPWSRDAWGYDPQAQFLANRGYAVLQPNFRGSTGYGKEFLNLGNRQWGTGTMQHDITDGVRYLVEQGIADPERVGIMGGSYGGYATLAGVAFTPELYAAGVSIVGPSSIPTLLNSIPPYWAPIRKIFAVRVGDMEKPEEMEMLRAQSPLYSADKIQAPLLVIQGANDPRVKQAESDQIVVALRDLGRPVQYLVAPDEGHGFAGRENRIAMYAGVERFLAEHLGGRVQEGMPEPIRERLQALTVDPATVTLKPAAPAEEEVRASMETFDASRLRPMTLVAQVKAGGSQVGTYNATLAREGTAWTASSTLKAGPASQQRTVRFGGDFTPIASEMRMAQGPMQAEIDLRYENGRVIGTSKLPPQMGGEQTIDTEVPRGTVFGGMDEYALAVADLQPGKTITLPLYNAEPGSSGLVNATFRVAGTETVTVPAGTFQTYRVEGTVGPQSVVVYLRQDLPHIPVKQEFVGQPISIELQSMQ